MTTKTLIILLLVVFSCSVQGWGLKCLLKCMSSNSVHCDCMDHNTVEETGKLFERSHPLHPLHPDHPDYHGHAHETLVPTTLTPIPTRLSLLTTTDICDALCAAQVGGDACHCIEETGEVSKRSHPLHPIHPDHPDDNGHAHETLASTTPPKLRAVYTTNICDVLCAAQMGGDACHCSKPVIQTRQLFKSAHVHQPLHTDSSHLNFGNPEESHLIPDRHRSPTATTAQTPQATAAQRLIVTTDICDILCSQQLGGDACHCSKPGLPGK